MSSYKELLKQREALEQKINEARRNELSEAVSQVRALVTEFGLTAQDVFPAGKARSASAGSKVAPKYRNPATGQTWTGRGKAPKWIQNENREQFAINPFLHSFKKSALADFFYGHSLRKGWVAIAAVARMAARPLCLDRPQ